jgi:hypothetical protein
VSTVIDTTGLFSEAAFGADGVPGLNGVTGAGEVHEAAWREAIDTALGSATDLSVETLSTELDSGVSEAVMAAGDVQQSNPVSWDRLSMTVASMVAWNMQIGMADDHAADILEAGQVLGSDAHVGESPVDVPVQDPAWSADIAAGEVALAVSTHELQRTLANVFEPTQQLNPLGKAMKGVSLPGGAIPSSTVDATGISTALQWSELGLAEGRSGTLSTEGSIADVNQGQAADVRGMADGSTGQSQLSSAELNSRSEISAHFESEPTIKADSGNTKLGDTLTTAVRAGLNQHFVEAEELVAVRHVHDSSVAKTRLDMGQERLQGIRAVLSELEAQVDLKSILGSERPAMAAGTAGLSVKAETIAAQMQQVESQARVAQVNGRPGLAMARSGEELKQQADGVQSESDGSGDFSVEDIEDAPRLVRGARRLIPIDKPVKVNLQGTSTQVEAGPVNTQADVNAVVAGNENAEITHDQEQAAEVAIGDARTIEASEIPELAIQDASSIDIDIDIDDALGSVRLAMTREAEAVSIRLETPQEVLEEFREMRSEMDERLAHQGLDLTEFSADAHGENTGESSPEHAVNKESNQGDSVREVKGSQDLAQDGLDARLVNRIV